MIRPLDFQDSNQKITCGIQCPLLTRGYHFFLTDPRKKNANKSLMYYFRCDIFVHNTSGNGLFGFTIQLLMKSYKNCSEKCSTVSSTYFFSAQNYSTYFCGRKKHTNDKKKLRISICTICYFMFSFENCLSIFNNWNLFMLNISL